MRTLYTERKKLLKVFKQMFEPIVPKELSTDVVVGTDFDYIPYQVSGAASHSANEYLELDNLNYHRDEQGISYLDTFIKLCVQVGGTMQWEPLTKEIEILKKGKDDYFDMYIESCKERNKEKANAMPEGGIHDELRKVRQELEEAKVELHRLGRIEKRAIELSKVLA